jgi:pimeloyl-ACP methyl ester carboxylesterase
VGDPVILIHGFTIDSRWNWESTGLIDLLAEDFQVVATDVRGHGGSEAPHNPSRYGAEILGDISRLLDHLDLTKAHLLGYSMGGEIVLAYLAFYPERVLRAVIGGIRITSQLFTIQISEMLRSISCLTRTECGNSPGLSRSATVPGRGHASLLGIIQGLPFVTVNGVLNLAEKKHEELSTALYFAAQRMRGYGIRR